MRALAFVAIVALLGCGEPSHPGGDGGGGAGGSTVEDAGGGGGGLGGGIGASFDRQALSGTRLKVRYLQGEDGSREPQGFFDTSRNEPCFFGVAEDGRMRCLPSDASWEGYFADAACAERISFNPDGCGGLKYTRSFLQQCPRTQIVYTATPYALQSLADGGTALYVGGSGSCYATRPPTGYKFYRIGAKIPASSFVAADFKVEQ